MLTQIALELRDLVRARALRDQARASAEWQAFYRTRRLQLREHPEDPLPRLGLAELWIAVQDWPRARAALEDLCARAPKFARGWSLLADLERFAGHPDAARADYARALELEPELPEARVGRGRLELAAGHAAAARADLERWAAGPAASEARFLEAHLDLARALLASGERAAAEARHARYRELGGAQPLDLR
jgi:predicted Zn-dependent protease